MMGDVPAEEEETESDEHDSTMASSSSMSAQKIHEERTSTLVAHLLFSIVWGVGGALDGPSRLKFDEFFRALCEMDAGGKYPR
jgi:dynein heavy chain